MYLFSPRAVIEIIYQGMKKCVEKSNQDIRNLSYFVWIYKNN